MTSLSDRGRRSGDQPAPCPLRVLLVLLATVLAVLVTGGQAQASSTSDCGYADQYVSSLTTEHLDDGSFKIHTTPTQAARDNGPTDWMWGWNDITVDMWHAAQSCTPGLYGSLADSIWQQLQCHVWGGPAEFATGPTYDLESWHHPLLSPGWQGYLNTHCLNRDDVDTGGNARYWDVPDDPWANVA